MEFEPSKLEFREVRLNQAYTTSLCISNPLAAAVEFTLKPSSARYSISPNRVHLSPNQSIVVTVRLFISSFPSHEPAHRGDAGGTAAVQDWVLLKSTFFDQKIPIELFLHSSARVLERKRDTAVSFRSHSTSPVARGRPGGNNQAIGRATSTASSSGGASSMRMRAAGATDLIEDLREQVAVRDHRIGELEGIIANLEAKHPSVQAIVRSKLEQEREKFEEKSQKVSSTAHTHARTHTYLTIVYFS